MRLCQPPDGNTSPKYKLLCFKTTKKNCKEKNALDFNRDRCCHLVLSLRLIPFHLVKHLSKYSKTVRWQLVEGAVGRRALRRLITTSGSWSTVVGRLYIYLKGAC